MLRSMDAQERSAAYESYSDLRRATERVVNTRFHTPSQQWDVDQQLRAKNDEIALLIYIANCCEVPISSEVSSKLAAFMAEKVTGGYGKAFQGWLQDAFDKKSQREAAFQKLRNEVGWLKDDIVKFKEEHMGKEEREGELDRMLSEVETSLNGVADVLDVTQRGTRQMLASMMRERSESEDMKAKAKVLCQLLVDGQVVEKMKELSEVVREVEESRASLWADLKDLEQRLRSTEALLRDSESASSEVVNQLLKEQEVTTNLRHVVRNLQEEYQESLQTISKQKMENESLKRAKQQQEEQLQEQRGRVEELEAAVKEGRRKEENLIKSHSVVAADLTKKLSAVEQQLEESQRERRRAEQEANELLQEVKDLRGLWESMKSSQKKHVEELLLQYQQEVDQLRGSHARDREEMEQQAEGLRRANETLEKALRERRARAASPDESSAARNPVSSNSFLEPLQLKVSLVLASEEPSSSYSEREAGSILRGLR